MLTSKEKVKRIPDHLPDDVGYENMQYHIYVREKIERGLADVQHGNVMNQEEVEKRMSSYTLSACALPA